MHNYDNYATFCITRCPPYSKSLSALHPLPARSVSFPSSLCAPILQWGNDVDIYFFKLLCANIAMRQCRWQLHVFIFVYFVCRQTNLVTSVQYRAYICVVPQGSTLPHRKALLGLRVFACACRWRHGVEDDDTERNKRDWLVPLCVSPLALPVQGEGGGRRQAGGSWEGCTGAREVISRTNSARGHSGNKDDKGQG